MRHDLEVRLTHKYVGSCAYEDEWESIGEYAIEAKTAYDQKDCIKTVFLVRAYPKNLDEDKDIVRRAIVDNFTTLGCHHEYDCCGCWNTYADVLTLGGWYYKVTTRSTQNY